MFNLVKNYQCAFIALRVRIVVGSDWIFKFIINIR